MYHNKKIGVFISHIMGRYQKNVCQGIIDKALEFGYTAEIFASMDGENLGEYGQGEESILRIPNYEDFNGIIFASETYPQPELRTKIYRTLKEKCHCPVVEISFSGSQFPDVSLENNSTAYELTRHLISEHHCKRICYLGCSEEAFYSDLRETFYRQALQEAGLPVSENDVFHAAYNECSMKDALSFFTAGSDKIDAIVCYNDKLALFFMLEAFNRGYHIPDDFAITGCDYSDEGQNIVPKLTTVSFPVYELGSTAVENLIKLMRNEELPPRTIVQAHAVFGNSCGCHNFADANTISYNHSLNCRIDSMEASILISMRMSAAFQNIHDIDDGMDLLENYIQSIAHCREFYLVLYSGWDQVSHHILKLTASEEETVTKSGEMLLKLAIRDGKRLSECSFTKNALLPEHIYKQSNSAYLYTPLYFGNREFGYIALAFEDNLIDYHFQLVHWFMNINQMLERICEAKKTSMLVNHLEDIYTKDALTGLYNKQGYLHLETLLVQEAVETESTLTCFMFDMDGLKDINDNFGHTEGDFAIQVIGHALSSMIRPRDICARFSGDEFYLLTIDYTEKDAEDLVLRVQKYLSNYNKLSNKKYSISASGGYAQVTPDRSFNKDQLKELFEQAGSSMYRQKEEHHLMKKS